MSGTAAAVVGDEEVERSTARLLRLTANLLPPEIHEHRRGVIIRWAALAAGAAVVVLLVGWYGYAWAQSVRQQDQLTQAGGEKLSLQRQQRAYSSLLAAQTATASINGHLKTLLATDVQWATLFTALRAAQPKGVELTSMGVALNDQTASTAGSVSTSTSVDSASGLPSADGLASIGALTVTGKSPTKAGVAAYLDALGAVPGVGNTLLSGVTESHTEGVQFTLRADLSKSAYSGYYTKSGG
jgi:hypothetical protein